MRRIFPEEGSQQVTFSKGYGTPLLSGEGIQYDVYLDEACTIPADILTMNGDPIPGAAGHRRQESNIPRFQGPDDGKVRLFVRQVGSVNVEDLRAIITEDELSDSPQLTIPHLSAENVWVEMHNLNCYPVVTTIDSGGTPVHGDVEYPDLNTVQVTFAAGPFSGTLVLTR